MVIQEQSPQIYGATTLQTYSIKMDGFQELNVLMVTKIAIMRELLEDLKQGHKDLKTITSVAKYLSSYVRK